MKSGNFNLLEPSGPLQACKGTALPFLLPYIRRHLRQRYISYPFPDSSHVTYYNTFGVKCISSCLFRTRNVLQMAYPYVHATDFHLISTFPSSLFPFNSGLTIVNLCDLGRYAL